jgi:hypothetical protein
MSQSANSDSTAYEEDWICLTCNKVAVDHLSLETELLSETVVILIESNGTRWLKCAGCDILIVFLTFQRILQMMNFLVVVIYVTNADGS